MDAIKSDVETVVWDLSYEMDKLQNQLLAVSLGLTNAEVLKVARYSQALIVQVDYHGDWSIHDPSWPRYEETRPEDAAQFMLHYCEAFLSLAQDAYPSEMNEVKINTPLSQTPIWRGV